MLMTDRMSSAAAHPPPLSAQLLIPAQQVNDPLTSTPPTMVSKINQPSRSYAEALQEDPRYQSGKKAFSREQSKTRLPTCVMILTGITGQLFGLTALVFGPSVSLRQQRRNGLPQKLGLGQGGRTLDLCRRFLLVQTGRRGWSRGLARGLGRRLFCFLRGLLLGWVLGV